jgi:hypothetical protein
MKNLLNYTKQIDIFGVPIPILTNRGEGAKIQFSDD